ncbi:MAG: FAD binding domain-containing protein [Pseudomonadota bacterium]
MPVNVRIVQGLQEAAEILAADRGAQLLGGGTLLVRAINEGVMTEGTLLRAVDPALLAVNAGGARVELGAGVTMAMVLANRDLSYLHAPARGIGGPAVRTTATIGGNLFAATPYGDFTTALLALDAVVTLHAGFGGAREIPLEEMLTNRARGGVGLVVSVGFNRPVGADAFRFLKVARVRPKGVSVLSIAAHLPQNAGRISGARIAYGAMGPTPLRAKAVERVLEGQSLDAATIAAAKTAALDGTMPATDSIASEWYRREVLPVHLGRLLAGETS